MSNGQFKTIPSSAALEELNASSTPVILFKHSSTCPISESAYDEMAKVNAPVNLVVVQDRRDLSNEIEEKTGIRHESPQVIILKNGQPVWNTSHRKITSAAVEEALRSNE